MESAGREITERVGPAAATGEEDRRLLAVERDRPVGGVLRCDRELGRQIGDRRDVEAVCV